MYDFMDTSKCILDEKSNITFVTAYIDFDGENHPFANRTHDWRFNKFRDIASTGIQLCVYVSPNCEEFMRSITVEYPNIKIMKTIAFEDLWSTQIINNIETTLPNVRNLEKDTAKYITTINNKVWFVNDAIESNPWNSTHFTWIDFSISHMFKNTKACQIYLKELTMRHLNDRFLLIPGCWSKLDTNHIDYILDNIHWRFCASFFIGDKESIKEFHSLYENHFRSFLENYKKLIWEANFWAWLEATQNLKLKWCSADHNDTVIHLHPDLFSLRLFDNEHIETIKCAYPQIEYFQPSSASYMYHLGRHWLNTRYVSYWLTPWCGYVYPDGTGVIRNINMLSELDATNENLLPIDYKQMDESMTGLIDYGHTISKGLEDIRIYSVGEEAHFIATTVNYSPSGKNRMVVGKYHVESATFSDCSVIESPNPSSWCEKNWIPIINYEGEELFIYNWSPMEIGKINHETKSLEIIMRHSTSNIPLFHRLRGSTTFTPINDGLIGLVHFSEEGSPRHYYNMLVLLDKTTFEPLRYSDVFHFETLGIEFCIGMAIENSTEKYIFWISRFDRDPLCVKIPVSEIPLIFSVM